MIQFIFLALSERNARALPWLSVALGLSFVTVLAVGVSYGPVFTEDGVRDQFLADALWAAKFDIDLYLRNARHWMDAHGYPQTPIPYVLFHAVLGGIRLTLEGEWHWGLIVLNAIAHVAALAMTVWLFLRAGGSTLGALAICAAGTVCWEFIQWIPQTQVDSSFVGVITVVFVLLACALPGRPKWLLAVIPMLVLANLWKPTASVSIVVAIVVGAVALFLRGREMAELSGRIRRLTLAGLVLLAALMPLAVYPLYDPSVLPEGFAENTFHSYRVYAQGGHTVWSRPEYQLSSMEGYGDYLVLLGARLVLFFAFTSELFSTGHNVVNIAFFVPFYALVLFGVWNVFAGRRLSHELRILGCIAVGWIVLYDALHSVTVLDFDWRYRTVVYPALLLLMACALEVLFAVLRERFAGPVEAQGG